ncbi:polysaccharide deacetylase family protein [Pseudanabaena sp. FACHB-2040]|uniref:polysaccharide deacetylase family protein n=1 Tax=Pseudanabaena sp. FACHB-2040 TaxID=2692859 RepID=UPI001685C208|nr:polysaccharide deacetylase family protein [Pseudanabaena sp. FACHB-2040]MBD2257270.1 polysaccharide deacetylase family protein [Pseudanabaena sp. FACHB-2040]
MPINLIGRQEDIELVSIVEAALIRSFSVAGVQRLNYVATEQVDGCYLFVNPQDEQAGLIEQLLAKRTKIILLGSLGVALGRTLGLEVEALEAGDFQDYLSLIETDTFDQSQLSIHYVSDSPILARLKARSRPLLRYDFTDEWNTLGFGGIQKGPSPWSICQKVRAITASSLAQLTNQIGQTFGLYASLTSFETSEVLWFNRQVGPVDSWEWAIVEDFYSHYRSDELPCIPHLREIPSGYQGAVTMRLDCDQAIATSRPLFELYRDAGLPFSLAVVTGLPPQVEDMALLRDVIAAGGSVVSHSVTHPPNWGADHAQALQEAQDSKRWLEQHLPEVGSVRYAVSPFHQNPPYAVQALTDAGYQGFVGGIIHNDPEYLIGRAGRVPFCEPPIVSHSQQCMLHGDCYHRYGNSVDPYLESFSNHLKAGNIFGYLDHPFSATYQYGWLSETERLAAHAELIRFIQSHEDIWFPNLVQCLDFVRKRDQVQISVEADQLQVRCDPKGIPGDLPTISVGWRGETIDLGI